MRFPSTLLGFPMTEGLWYVLVIAAAILILMIVLRIFKNIVKDFASGAIIFIFIVVFALIFLNLISRQYSLENTFGSWFNRMIP